MDAQPKADLACLLDILHRTPRIEVNFKQATKV